MAGPINFEKVTEAIGVLLDYYEQNVEPNGQLKDGELKQKIEELKPKIQARLEGCKKRGGRRQRKMLEKLEKDKNFKIGKYSHVVAEMVRCQYKGRDDGDSDDDADEA